MKRRRLLIIPVIAAIALALAGYYHLAGQRESSRIAVPLPSAAPGTAQGAPVDTPTLMRDVTTLASPAFEGRFTGSEGGRKARAYVRGRFEAIGLTPFGAAYDKPFSFTRSSMKALLTPGKAYKTEHTGAANLIGYIAGAKAPGRYIVVSAHYDHLGVKGGKMYPGADDNASGVAAMLQLAAHFQAHRPDHSIVFAAFDAEEGGLNGAEAFMDDLPFPREQLAFNLNLDMVSRSDERAIFASGTSYHPELKALVAQAAARSTVKVRLGHDRPVYEAGKVEDWTHSSDHGAFHDAGVPFLYFGVEDHADYHQPSDTADKIDPGFFTDVVKLLIDVAGLLDRRP